MSTNGPGPVGGQPSLPPGARRAPTPPCQHGPQRRPSQVRTVVIGGGAAHAHGPGPSSGDRLAAAARGVRSGAVPAQPPRPPAGGVARPVDPALATLAVLLGDSAMPERPPSLGQRIAGQLAQLLQATTARLGVLFASGEASVRGGGDAAVLDARPQSDAPAAQQPLAPPPRVPLQPPPPTLTLDPTLGTIVHDDGAGGSVPLGSTPDLDGGDARRMPLVPSSWVPVTGVLGRLGAGGRDGALRLLGGIDRILERSGLTRLQLLALTLIAPAVVAFLIDVVVSMLAGR